MWAALPFHRQPGSHGSNFLSALDMTDVFDYTRYYLTMRRRGGRLYDHGVYIAPRESRHIMGEVVLTLEDQLTLARFPDTVCVMFSNYDMKGQHVADIVDFGVNPPHADIEIPFRAIVSKTLDQILIAGKAFSLTHDACAAPRMQRDLQLLGGVAGMAAAQAVRDKTTVKALDGGELQHHLAETGNLLTGVIDRGAELAPPRLQQIANDLTGDERFEWLEMLATERVTEVSPVIRLCCSDADEVAPMLLSALRGSRGRKRLLLARLLLWHSRPEGLAPVMKEIDRIWDADPGFPKVERDRWWAGHVPEHGIMPEVVHLLFALTRVRDRRIVPLFEEAVRRLEAGSRDYTDKDTRVFDYVRMVSVAAERTGLPEFVPLLERLLALPELQEAVRNQSIEQGFIVERQAYLVLYLQRALARCGRKAGLLGLAQMLTDTRALIARSALQELQAVTGADHPLNADIWTETLVSWPEEFPSIPWESRLT